MKGAKEGILASVEVALGSAAAAIFAGELADTEAGAIEMFTLFGLIPNFCSVCATASDNAFSKLPSEDGSVELPGVPVTELLIAADTLLN
jgi:hypothetical protein